jgi:hypothetical protein
VSEEPDPAALLADISALVRSRTSPLLSETLPDSFIARMRECERLAGETIYPEMAEIMLKLAELWREMVISGAELIGENGGEAGVRQRKP